MNTPAQAELGRGTLRSEVKRDCLGHPAAISLSASGLLMGRFVDDRLLTY